MFFFANLSKSFCVVLIPRSKVRTVFFCSLIVFLASCPSLIKWQSGNLFPQGTMASFLTDFSWVECLSSSNLNECFKTVSVSFSLFISSRSVFNWSTLNFAILFSATFLDILIWRSSFLWSTLSFSKVESWFSSFDICASNSLLAFVSIAAVSFSCSANQFFTSYLLLFNTSTLELVVSISFSSLSISFWVFSKSSTRSLYL